MIENITKEMPFDEKVKVFNQITQELYDWLGVNHPALNVQLVPADKVIGNDYNPNHVAPPEMKLLKLSIKKDGRDIKGERSPDGFYRFASLLLRERRTIEAIMMASPKTIMRAPLMMLASLAIPMKST